MSEISKINKYGKEVFCDVIADNMRRERCLCWKCNKLKPEQPDNCEHAQIFFDECQKGLAIAVTRCADYEEDEQDE